MRNRFGEEWECYAMKVRRWFIPGLVWITESVGMGRRFLIFFLLVHMAAIILRLRYHRCKCSSARHPRIRWFAMAALFPDRGERNSYFGMLLASS